MKTFLDESRRGKIEYVEALKDYQIMPNKLNILHFFSNENQSEALLKAFELGTSYIKDNGKYTPLEYALDMNNGDCVDVIIDKYFEHNLDIKDIQKQSIKKLLNQQPLKLIVLFEHAVEQVEEIYGQIRDDEEILFLESPDLELTKEEID